jgi:hypothetical protein
MAPMLRLYEDVFANTAQSARLPALPRMIFVVHGAVSIAAKSVAAEEAWQDGDAVALAPGPEGATCWRWELSQDDSPSLLSGTGVSSREKLSARLDTLPAGELLMRGDSVAFPPGGCAFLHRHEGPGLRCLIEGGIRIDTHGRSTCYGPGSAWYESGADPVFAQAAADRPSRFIRVMILPRALLGGTSSIRYVRPEDLDRPKSQRYQLFVDQPIAWPR